MKTVYLIRHGLPEFPAGKKMCLGITDLPMGEAGLAQAAQMARELPPVTRVFSSPLTRAVRTAEAIGMDVVVLEGLREMDAGEWDGLTFGEIRQRYPDLYAARGKDLTLPLPGGEDAGQALLRFTEAMEQATALAPGDFAVVAHGGIIARFLRHISGKWYKPDYTEVVTLVWKDGTFELKESLSL